MFEVSAGGGGILRDGENGKCVRMFGGLRHTAGKQRDQHRAADAEEHDRKNESQCMHSIASENIGVFHCYFMQNGKRGFINQKTFGFY